MEQSKKGYKAINNPSQVLLPPSSSSFVDGRNLE
jgi:hypothetical protein